MTTTPSADPFIRIDELTTLLSKLHNQISAICAEANRQHAETDERFARPLGEALKAAQEAFDELHRLSEAHRTKLLPRDKKSARRPTGTIGWRSVPRVIKSVTDDELIERIRNMGLSTYRKLVRRTVRYEINNNALITLANREIVEQIPGLTLDRKDDFYARPTGGYRMSSAEKWWPRMEGLPTTYVLHALTSDAGEP